MKGDRENKWSVKWENNLGEVVGSCANYLIMRHNMNWEPVGQTFHFQWKEQLINLCREKWIKKRASINGKETETKKGNQGRHGEPLWKPCINMHKHRYGETPNRMRQYWWVQPGNYSPKARTSLCLCLDNKTQLLCFFLDYKSGEKNLAEGTL